MVPESDDTPSRRPVLLAGIAVAVVALVVVLVAAALGRDGGQEAGDSTVGTVDATTAPDSTVAPASTDATVTTTPRVTATTAPPGVTCEPITLALLTQLSGGEHDWDLIVDAAELAVDEFNDDNPNCSVTLDVLNSEESPELAATQADNLRNDDQVLGAVAVYLSDQVATAGPVLNHLGIPFIVSQAKRATLNDEGLRTFNRVVGDEYAPADGAAAYLRDTLGAERVYVVDNGQGAALADRLAENLGDLVVGRSEVAPDQQDLTDVVDDVFADAADTVYYSGSYQQGGLLVSALRERGFEGTFMMPETLNEARLSETAGGAAEGALLTCNCAPVDRPQAFVTAFREATGSDPEEYVPETYDATRLLLAGLEAGVTDREGMIDFVRSYDGRGVTGTIAFDDRGELVGNRSYLYRVETGSAAYADSLP